MSKRDNTRLKQLQAGCRRASKNEKTVILDECVEPSVTPTHEATNRFR